MEYKAYSARTPEDHRTLSTEHHLQVVLDLELDDLKSPASKWNSRHLLAYRLLALRETAFLRTFKVDHDEHCPVCKPDQSCSQKLDDESLQVLLDENPRELYTKTEGELMRLPGGFFWTALARAARSELADQVKAYPERERKSVQQTGFVNSSEEILGSSSPIQLSASEFEVELDDPDEDMHEERRSKPEQVTVYLVASFLQYTLGLCLLQNPAGPEARARVEPKQTTVQISKGPGISAEDDGGICSMDRTPLGWKMDDPYLALLEAKRAFRYLYFDERTGDCTPITSNTHLAQYLGEAVITWKGNRDRHGLRKSIFLIAATNSFVRFIHFTFGRDYMEYLDTDDVVAQKNLANDPEKDTFVYMRSSKWFNLQHPKGRRAALCHTLALLRWHDQARDLTEESNESHGAMDLSDDGNDEEYGDGEYSDGSAMETED